MKKQFNVGDLLIERFELGTLKVKIIIIYITAIKDNVIYYMYTTNQSLNNDYTYGQASVNNVQTYIKKGIWEHYPIVIKNKEE